MASGEEGWFPRTFVAFEMPSSAEEQVLEDKREGGDTEAVVDAESSVAQVIAAYTAEGEGEIDLFEGRKVYVTEADDASGWSYGDVEQGDGSFLSGWFPASYVGAV